ncbi:MAG: acyl--CoA ligase [Phycisphaerae bacterium]|nr:acyl--CoA ligase [Phycisphaerae bacterium]
MSAGLLERLDRHARERPRSAAVCAGPGMWTWTDLAGATRSAARVVEAKSPEGGVVMLSSPNRAEFVAAYLGVLAAGRVVFPVPAGLPRAELVSLASRSGAGLLIGESRAREAMRELAWVSMEALVEGTAGEDAASATASGWSVGRAEGSLYLPSSGTTGLPKIARRSGESLAAVARNVAESAGLGVGDRVLAAVPMSHSYGMENGLLGPVWAGSCVEVCEGFDVGAIFALLEAGRVTAMPGVPFLLEALANLGGSGATGLRRAWSAGAPLPESVGSGFARRFGVRVEQLYGSTEVGSVTFGEAHERGGVGRPMRGVSVRVVDVEDARREVAAGSEGQVAIRSPSMLSGYVDGEAPIVDGHFLTGDLGRVDEAGRLTITGRLKLLIDVGGLKVNPLEVEQVLSQHAGVVECVVGPERVSETLTRLRAYVVTRGAGIEAGELRAFLRERLASHKVPRSFEFRSGLPKSPTGKVLRQKLETL